MNRLPLLVLVSLVPFTAMPAAPSPPVAAVKPHVVESPHGNRVDNYYWLRDDTRQNPAMLSYLGAENAYTDATMAPLKGLQEKLYAEITGRLKPDDSTVPWRKNGWLYYQRYDTGKEYPIYARRRGSMEAPEQVMLDVNELARGRDYFHIAEARVSPDGRYLAWLEDTVSRRQYTLRIKDLETGRALPDRVENLTESLAWTAGHGSVLCVERDPVTLLGMKVRRHVVNTDASKDEIVYRQPDTTFSTSVANTKDDRYVLIHSDSTLSTELRYADAADPRLKFQVFLPRERNHEYSADHLDGRWIIRSNWQAQNFRLMEAKVGEEGDRLKWRELIGHRDDALINDFDVFRNFLAVEERSGGLRRIRIRPWSGEQQYFIAADEPTYAFQLADNPEIDTDLVRYTYDSLTTPTSTLDYDTRTRTKVLLKREPVLGGFDPSNYASEFRWATARDGKQVPVSLVYRKGFKRDRTAPLLQYGYGSYGYAIDPRFSSALLSLLDRGFVYAIAHIRGGEEMGRNWYEDGKLLRKWNTFTDYVDVTRFLVKEQYADARRVFAVGRSAGGLLMGVVANVAPRDYRGIIAGVPFVDAVTTMLDESIPLTTLEFDEWGNPKLEDYYDYILSYSPYDNVARQAYPALFVNTGLWDSQVQYYEPAKWVARLRAMKTDSNPLLFRVEMDAGHGGKSGRYRRLRETAEEYAFILDQAGIRE
jgi:oligopeptidase B